MIALVFVAVLVALFPLLFSDSYLAELMLSFLPYIAGIILFGVIIAFVQFKKRMKPGYHPTRRYFRGISFLVLCLLFFIYSKQFNHFYVSTPLPSQTESGSLKILYANIHKDNIQYSEIEQLISDTNPDLLMFVEFADHHYIQLKDVLKTKYPYTNTTSRSKTFVGSTVFSKYPINNRADDFPQGARRYGYFSVPYQGQELYFYLVHTSSPDSYQHFLMRNEQLKTFVQDFQKHESERQHDNIIVVGDFNITPWSTYYSLLDTPFSGTLTNATIHLPFLTTRKLKQFPLFQAHIDHLWMTPSIGVQGLEAISLPGSDHKALLFTLQM